MKEMLKILTALLGDQLSPAALLKLALTLAPIAKDLGDGDAHLSPENRLKIQEAVEEFKEGLK